MGDTDSAEIGEIGLIARPPIDAGPPFDAAAAAAAAAAEAAASLDMTPFEVKAETPGGVEEEDEEEGDLFVLRLLLLFKLCGVILSKSGALPSVGDGRRAEEEEEEEEEGGVNDAAAEGKDDAADDRGRGEG